ncbi:MAG: signal recognition particle receptor subunit alpha, partial [Opitutaceae bacterium]
MFGLFRKFKEGLAKTVGAIASKTRGLFSGRAIDASSLESLEEALYTADFGVATTEEILAEIKDAAKRDKELRGQEAAAIGAAVLSRVLAGSEGTLTRAAKAPTTIVMIGVNGSGKTTTTAKLARHLIEK